MRVTLVNRVCTASLIAIVLLGMGLRCIDLDASLYGDEISTYHRAKAPLAYSVARLSTPLYEVLAHLSISIVDNEPFLRLPALVAGVGTIIAIYFIATSLGGPAAGLVAASLLATLPYHVNQSQHARYYALMTLAGLAWAALLSRAVERGRWGPCVGYAGLVFLGLFIHQFCMVFLFSMSVGATAYVLVSRSIPGFGPKARRLAALVLCTAVATSGIAALFAYQGTRSPLEFIAKDKSDIALTAGHAAATPAGSESKPVYRLTPREYAGYLQEMASFPGQGGGQTWFYVALALVGAFVTFRHRPAFAWIAAAMFLVTPAPLFFLSVTHSYSGRYFTMLLPIGVCLVAVGLTACCGWAAVGCTFLIRRIVTRARGPQAPEGVRGFVHVKGILVAIVLVALSPFAARSLGRYYAWQPEVDYKGLAEYMTRTITPHDVVYYVDPSNLGMWRFRTPLVSYYFKRCLDYSGTLVSWLNEFIGTIDEKELTRLASEFPDRNIWFIAFQGHQGKCGALLDRVCPGPRTFNRLVLWVWAEPTVNMIRNGGFEDVRQRGSGSDAAVEVVSGPDAYSGQSCLRLQILDAGVKSKQASFRVNAPKYRSSCVLRNPGFEVWRAGGPTGWTPAMGRKSIRPSRQAHSGKSALEVQAGVDKALLRQRVPTGLAPGRTVELKAFGKADSPGLLSLALAYTVAGQSRREVAAHPGDGAWGPISIRVGVPAEAEPESVAVEIARESNASSSVFVDDVELSIVDVEESLDPTRTYTLSMMLRYENLRSFYETSNLQDAASVMLAYHTPEGKDEQRHLDRFYGSSDWRYVAFQIKPGADIPIGSSWLLASVALYGTGTIWIDDVQFEPQDHPTPFTEGTRLPHDESLAQGIPGVTGG